MRLGMTIMVAAAFGLFAASAALGADPQDNMGGMDHGKMSDQNQSAATAKMTDAQNSAPLNAYPLDFCIISGEKLGEMGDPVSKTYDGREVRFCCNMCPKTFEKDQAKYFKKLDEAIIAKEKPSYPLQTCVVTGEKLEHSEMGDPVDYVYNNHLVRFCCSGCISRLKKEPAKYLKMIGDAYAASGSTQGTSPAPASEQKDQHDVNQH